MASAMMQVTVHLDDHVTACVNEIRERLDQVEAGIGEVLRQQTVPRLQVPSDQLPTLAAAATAGLLMAGSRRRLSRRRLLGLREADTSFNERDAAPPVQTL